MPERLEHYIDCTLHSDSNTILALLLLDLDRFRSVNSCFGHAAGDRVLEDTVQRVQALLPEGAEVYRYSGDEFYCILPSVESMSDLYGLSHCILKSLNEPYWIQGKGIYINGSIGISLHPNDGLCADDLISCAGLAMRKAKERGGGFQVFYPDMFRELKPGFHLEKELRASLQEEQLTLYYQPLIDMKTGQITGLEALLRWHHPGQGEIMPSRFISQAEETGLMIPIGKWVLEEACRQYAKWSAEGLDGFLLSVNVSVLQLLHPGFLQHVEQTIRHYGISPEYLQLELTESVSPGNNVTIMETVRRLQALGVQIAVDDFGTGYTSLSTLKRFPVHTLKIDRSLVQDAHRDDSSAAIITALVTLCQRLGVRSLAEGVETPEQHQFLKELGCQEAQGFLYCCPAPADRITGLLKRRLPAALSPFNETLSL